MKLCIFALEIEKDTEWMHSAQIGPLETVCSVLQLGYVTHESRLDEFLAIDCLGLLDLIYSQSNDDMTK